MPVAKKGKNMQKKEKIKQIVSLLKGLAPSKAQAALAQMAMMIEAQQQLMNDDDMVAARDNDDGMPEGFESEEEEKKENDDNKGKKIFECLKNHPLKLMTTPKMREVGDDFIYGEHVTCNACS